MKTPKNLSPETAFKDFIADCEVRGVKGKTLQTYQQHFRSISKKLDVSISLDSLRPATLDAMISEMRSGQLFDQSISNYTRTLRAFLSWCNEKIYADINISICKACFSDVKGDLNDSKNLMRRSINLWPAGPVLYEKKRNQTHKY